MVVEGWLREERVREGEREDEGGRARGEWTEYSERG